MTEKTDPAPRAYMPPYRMYRPFLDSITHARLLEWTIKNEAKFEASLVSGDHGQDHPKHDPHQRTSLYFSDFGPMQAMLRQLFVDFVPTLIGDLRVTPFEVSQIELELVANNDGTFFKRHIDTFTGDGRKASDRMLSAVYYFHAEPKAFSGGELRLYSFGTTENESAFVDVQPEQNTLVAFPSWAIHEVLPVNCPSRRFSDSRFNINCWIHRQARSRER